MAVGAFTAGLSALGSLANSGGAGGAGGGASADQILADTTSGSHGAITVNFAPFPNQGAPSTPGNFDMVESLLPAEGWSRTLVIGSLVLVVGAFALKAVK